MTNLAYFKRDGLVQQRGGPLRSTYRWENTAMV